MYSSDGGTDPSMSDDISISIHSSISSPTVLSQTLPYSIQLPLLLNTRPNSRTLHTISQYLRPKTRDKDKDSELRTQTQNHYRQERRVYIALALKVL